MVLRGSKTRPEGSLAKAREDLREKKEQYSASELRLNQIRDCAAELRALQLAHKDEKLSTSELMDLLQHQIVKLEDLHRDELAETKKSEKAVKKVVRQLVCGGLAGATARTFVAPIDRVKILLQTQHLSQKGATKYTGVLQTWKTILAEEGPARLWRGNFVNVLRVAPYSATQFASYDFYKSRIIGEEGGNITILQRVLAGACAGMTATSVTHPMDVIRLRLNVQPELKGLRDAAMSVWRENGVRAMYKGYFPSLLSLGPFIGINFATFDTLQTMVYDKNTPRKDRSNVVVLGLGAAAGLFAQTCCYPLDTVRRRMQMKDTPYKNTANAFATIFRQEGPLGFYKGMLPNAIKVVPNNAIRFMAFEFFKNHLMQD